MRILIAEDDTRSLKSLVHVFENNKFFDVSRRGLKRITETAGIMSVHSQMEIYSSKFTVFQ